MSKITDFELSKKQLEELKKLEEHEEYMELKLVSNSDITACPLCRGGGCYGSCQMQGC